MTINEDDTYPDEETGLSRIADRLGPDAPYSQSHQDKDLSAILEEEASDEIPPTGRFLRLARNTKIWFRLAALVFLGCFLIGWPAGTMWANYAQTGIMRFALGFTLPVFLNMIAIPLLIYIIGHVLSLGFRMAAKAEELEISASRLTQPDVQAISGVRSVGQAVKSEIDTLNLHLDEALEKLASVESMIRQQVRAIDDSAGALEDGSSQSVAQVMAERQKLIELTENLNHEADSFAEAIAEKAKLGLEQTDTANARIIGAEKELDQRLNRLEETASKALDAFDRLSRVLEEKETLVTTSSATLNAVSEQAVTRSAETVKAIQENADNLTAAQNRLEEESKRLESLIEDQRDRAGRLADAITEQTSKLTDMAKAPLPELPEMPVPSATQVQPPPPSTPAAQERIEPVVTRTPDPAPQAAPPTPLQQAPHKPLSLGGISADTDEEEPIAPIAPLAPSAPLRAEPETPTLNARVETAASIKEERQTKSWSDILAAADEPEEDEPLPLEEEPAPPVAATATADDQKTHVISLVRNMQHFMYQMESQLYGAPQQATTRRFDGGERNIFANMLLRRNEEDVKNRIRLETARNDAFEKQVYAFLTNFDRLLEPATGEKDGENLIDDYLGSPLGQVYLLTGSAMDYFS